MKPTSPQAVRILCAILLLGILSPSLRGQDAGKPGSNRDAAAEYLDSRAKWWLGWSGAARGQGTACISCHTTLSYALGRSMLGDAPGEIEQALIDNVKKRVANWDGIVVEAKVKDPFKPFYTGQRRASALGTESVVNALVLVNHDARRGKGTMSESTRKAFAHLWSQQQADGAWLWLDFGLRPWEADATYYGAALAAVALGKTEQAYREEKDVQPKLAAVTKYLATHQAKQPLHHRMVALWSRLPGVFVAEEQKKLAAEIVAAQEKDGGWSVARLGKSWKSHGATHDGAVSDGYATGLAILALRAAKNADDPAVTRGIAWLRANQKNGVWPGVYLNQARDAKTDAGKFMQDAAVAFAVLALTSDR